MKKSFLPKLLKCTALIALMTMLFVLPLYAGGEAVVVPDKGAEEAIGIDELIASQKPGEIAFGVFHSLLAQDQESEKPEYGDIVENYAGSVIDADGNLVVYITGDLSTLSSLRSRMAISGIKEDDVQFIEVQYSYEELKEQQKAMWDFRNKVIKEDSRLKAWAKKIISVAVSPGDNCVSVMANEFALNDYSICEEYFGDYSFKVLPVNGTGEIHEELTVFPGQGLSTGGSLGFRCYLNGVLGFVTAVHTSNYVGTVVKSGATDIGMATAGMYDGKSDFAFVTLYGGHAVARTTNTYPAYTMHSTRFVVALPINYSVHLAGANSTGIRSGKVLSYDFSMKNGNEWLLCDYSSAGGDSGGLIFAIVNGDNCIVGIHDGAVDYNNGVAKYGTKLTTMTGYYNISL